MTHAPQTRERAIQAYFAGRPVSAIEQDVGVGRNTLYVWLRQHGVIRHYKTNSADIKRLYREGLSDGSIGRMLGVHTTTVYKWRQRQRLPANFLPGYPLTRCTSRA
jgi:transposase-like protein